MKIGENIKKYRKKFGFTQGYLAEQLNVSVPAVSKWESGTAMPDVTNLVPIAKLFNISVDQLLGYDCKKEENEIENVLNEYSKLNLNGDITKAQALISKARTLFPSDYRVMNEYMWNIAGGRNVKDQQLLISNHKELDSICKRILDGCKNEKIRYEAKLMKAKLLYVSSRTEDAIDILNSLPRWHETAGHQMELLFAPNTDKEAYWIKRNAYCLADGLAYKIVKSIWNDNKLSMKIKAERIVQIGELFHRNWIDTGETVFLIIEHMIFSALAKKLLAYGSVEDKVLKLMSLQLSSAKEITSIACSDTALSDLLKQTYKTDNLLEYTLSFFITSDNIAYKKIRLKSAYSEMLSAYTKE